MIKSPLQTVAKKLVNRLFGEVWGQKKNIYKELFLPKVILHAGQKQIVGIKAIQDLFHHWFSAFPDIYYDIKEEIYCENKAVIRWEGGGTHLAIFNGLLPTKRKMQYDGTTIFHIDSKKKKFAEIWISSDLTRLFSSLQNYSTKTYSKKDFCEDFKGPSKKIYEWIMKARTEPSCRQVIANALRAQFATVPMDPKVQIVEDPKLFENVLVEEKRIPTKEGKINIRLYMPKQKPKYPPGLLVYFHGGGWIAGSLDGSDIPLRKLCHQSGCVAISVDYRLAPEHPFPAPLNDCVAAYKWAREKAKKELKFPVGNKVVVVGEASGGTLAVALIMKMRDEGYKIPDGALLLCCVTDLLFERYPSFLRFAPKGLFFDSAFSVFAREAYASYEQWKSPYVSPMYGNVKKFCPTFMLSPDRDPFFDDNVAFGKKLKDNGIQVEQLIHKKMDHGYYFFSGFTKEEKQAFHAMANFLKKTFS